VPAVQPCYSSPNAVTPYSIDISVPRASFNILPVAYAMMERMDTQVQYQGRRRRGGLCHGRGSSDRAPAPAGPPDLSHLQLQFQLDDTHLEALRDELIKGQRLAADEEGAVLVWIGDAASPPAPAVAPASTTTPLTYTPPYLAEKILTSRSALEGERKQVTVLFADLKGSMELLADRDPEEARRLLDPVLERMMAAVHRYEGTVNQVMGDGIMALFGAPLAHEDRAVRACYAALHMQEAIGRYAEELRRQQGLDVQIRGGLNAGEVVVRAIGNDLHMDYTAVGQTTHLAARMEQLARPGPADRRHPALGRGLRRSPAAGAGPREGVTGPDRGL
jgi:class 3 adenylate cyclase